MARLISVHINGVDYLVDERLCELRNVDNPLDAKGFGSQSDFQCYLYWTRLLQPIVGQTVTSAELVYDDGLDGWVPLIHFRDGFCLALLSDQEGNSPGRFEFRID